MEEDKVFVETVVKYLVAHPEDVRVDRTIDERGVLLTLNINQADMGQIIGRKGQTVGAVRTLLRVVGAKHNARVNLKITNQKVQDQNDILMKVSKTSILMSLMT